jgi:hypothetical protein
MPPINRQLGRYCLKMGLAVKKRFHRLRPGRFWPLGPLGIVFQVFFVDEISALVRDRHREAIRPQVPGLFKRILGSVGTERADTASGAMGHSFDYVGHSVAPVDRSI